MPDPTLADELLEALDTLVAAIAAAPLTESPEVVQMLKAEALDRARAVIAKARSAGLSG